MNLIGEHTDYSGGFVLPIAIHRGIRGAVRARDDGLVTVISDGFGTDSFPLDVQEISTGDWRAYPRSVMHELRAVAGARLRGFDLALVSDLPARAGLASSAALEAAVARAAVGVAGFSIDPIALAGVCQRAEHSGPGVQCGIMDQAVVLASMEGFAMLLDCRTYEALSISFPTDHWSIVAIDTLKDRTLAASAYNERRQSVEEATAHIARIFPEIRDLSDVSPAVLDGSALPEHLHRRARHVVTENLRTLQLVIALSESDATATRQAMAGSHASLRDDYEVSCPELDALVAHADATGICDGSRLTGAGFGGCTVNLVPHEEVDAFVAQVQQRFLARFGAVPTAHHLHPGAPATFSERES